MVKCVVCKKREATQEHHICYDPEMKIDVCVECHEQLHKHGVGLGRGRKKVLEEHLKKEEKPQYPPLYTKKIRKEPYDYIVAIKDGEILEQLICPNCGETLWSVYGHPISREVYVRCWKCGYDRKIRLLDREEE